MTRRSDKLAASVAWLGDASIMCVGGALFGGEDWRSREIVGRVMKWRGFGLPWRNVYVAYPVPWLVCLHFSRMYGGLFDFRRFVLLTSEKKRHGTDQGSGILILQQKPKATERNGTPHNFT